MRLFVSLDDSSTQLPAIIERLREEGVHPVGGAMADDRTAIILFDKPEDTDRAIAWLKRIGLHAGRDEFL